MTTTRTPQPTRPMLIAALDLVDAVERARHSARGLDGLWAVNLAADYDATVEHAADAVETLAEGLWPNLADAMTGRDGETANLAHRVAVTLGNLGRNVL